MTTYESWPTWCKNCKSEFSKQILTSTNNFGGVTTDFYERASGESPLNFEILTCPKCGYSTRTGEKPNDLEIDDRIKELVALHITPQIDGFEIPCSTKFCYAAMIAEWKGEPNLQVGYLYQQASWCCYDDGNVEEEHSYRRLAIKHFIIAIEKEKLDVGLNAKVTYVIGELYRRIGEIKKSKLWLSRVPAQTGDIKEYQWLSALAKQQIKAPREFLE